MKILSWVEGHPWETGGAVLVGGVVLLYFFGAFGGSSSAQGTGEDPNVAAYLSAEATQDTAGDELQAVQDQDQATTAQAGINAQANVDINNAWATAGVQNNLISGLSAIGENTGTVLTSSSGGGATYAEGGSQGGGLLGNIFGSSSSSYNDSNYNSSSSQTFVQNQEQGEATGLLGQITSSEFNAGN